MPSTALLVIGVQRNRFEGTAATWDGVELLARLSVLVARARADGVPVIFVRNCGGPGEPDEPGTPGWELSPALPRLAGEPIVDKRSPDAFVGTGLNGLLRARGVRRVIVCGVQSEFCIHVTSRGAVERGYEATLVEDTVLSSTQKPSSRNSAPQRISLGRNARAIVIQRLTF